MAKAANHNVYFVPGLQRGLQTLEILGASETALSLSELAKELDLSRSSAFRVVYTLRHMNFIKEGEQKKTSTLGARVLNLGFAYLNQQPITSVARPHLASLRDETNISAHLSVLEGNDVLYLGSHQARSGFVSNMVTGTRRQAYSSPVGWCLLGGLSEEDLENFCEKQDFNRQTEYTPVTPEALIARVQEVRDRGHVFSKGFRKPGGSSVAAGVRDHTGGIVACINVSGPDIGFEFDKIDSFYVPAVLTAALQISRELGFVGRP